KGRGMLSQFAGNSAQIRQGTSLTPAVSRTAKGEQRSLVECARAGKVALVPGDVGLLVQGPGSPATITEALEDLHGFGERHPGAGIVTTNLGDIADIVQTACGRNPIGHGAEKCQALFEVGLRGDIVSSITRANGSCVPRECNPQRVIELF